jgi:hypothetical protein
MLADFLVSFRLNLAYALTRDTEFFSYLFECMRNPVEKPMSHFQDLPLLRTQIPQDLPYLIGKDTARCLLIR